MNKKIINDTCDITAQTKKNTLRLFFWTGAWVLATAGAAFGPRFLWDFNTLPTVLGVLVHIGIGFGMIRMFRQHLLGWMNYRERFNLMLWHYHWALE